MKKIMTMIFILSVIFVVRAYPQQPGDSRPLSDNSTMKGKRQLRHEKKIHKSSVVMASKNEKAARRKHKLGTMNHHDSKSRKIAKNNKRAKMKSKSGKGKESTEAPKETSGD
jgi:hypothetical protein